MACGEPVPICNSALAMKRLSGAENSLIYRPLKTSCAMQVNVYLPALLGCVIVGALFACVGLSYFKKEVFCGMQGGFVRH